MAQGQTEAGHGGSLHGQFRGSCFSLYGEAGMMLDADTCQSAAIGPLIRRLLVDPAVHYLHVHNARRGGYAGRLNRVR